jgi:hypothetical protein
MTMRAAATDAVRDTRDQKDGRRIQRFVEAGYVAFAYLSNRMGGSGRARARGRAMALRVAIGA